MNHIQNSSAVAVAVDVVVPVTPVTPVTPVARARRPRDLDACIVAACDRDPDAAEIVASRLRPRLLAAIERVLGDEHEQDAEDVLDALFVAILEGGVTIMEGIGPLRSLMNTARSFARDHLHNLQED